MRLSRITVHATCPHRASREAARSGQADVVAHLVAHAVEAGRAAGPHHVRDRAAGQAPSRSDAARCSGSRLVVIGMRSAGLRLGVTYLAEEALRDGVGKAVFGVRIGRAGADEQRRPLVPKVLPVSPSRSMARG